MSGPWSPLPRAASRSAFALLVALVLWLPLPYGSVTPLARMILEVAAFGSLALVLLSGAPAHVLAAARPMIAAVLLLIALGLLQILPLPGAVLRAASPESAGVVASAGRVLALHGKPGARAAISIAPGETLSSVLSLAAWLALFVASALSNGSRRRRGLFALALCAASLFQVGYGLTEWDAANPASNRLRGSFVNPNHLAGYLALGLSVAFALLYAEILTGADRERGAHLSEKLETRFLPLALRGLLWVALCVGILLSQSRAGVAAALGSTGVLVVFSLLRRRSPSAGAAFVIVAALALAGAFAAEPVVARLLQSDPRDLSTDTRAQIRSASARAARRYPVLGSGLGTFADVFLRDQPRDLAMLVDHAHDDYVEIRATGGWTGFLLALFAAGAAFAGLLRSWLRQKHRLESALALAGLGAIAALAFHAFFEFNFAIPAIPATSALLLGWSFAAAESPPDAPHPA